MAEAVAGELVGAGRSADVYAAGEGRVLRRYRDGRPPAAVAREAEVMAHARAHGVPVPEVCDVAGRDIVMERVDGPTMLDAVGRRPWTYRAQARLLAGLHAAVHAVPALDWLRAPFGEGDGAQVLLHRDLHPQNVILTADGPRIIDWEGAARGPAAGDVAMTWAIVGFSSPPGGVIVALEVRAMQALFNRAFLRAAGPVDREWLAAAVRQRLADPHVLPQERARLERLRVARV
jgi:aminoglycoside phosphotransferase (APT) family kinase protein